MASRNGSSRNCSVAAPDGNKPTERQKAGLVLILPIHPMGEHLDSPLKEGEEIDLLHGTWKETEQALLKAGWRVRGKWVEHVHASLSRLILHATIVPQD